VTAAQQYFSNLEARGADPKTIRTYRSAVDPFLENCGGRCDQPGHHQFHELAPKAAVAPEEKLESRSHYANKVGHVAIFLKAFGVSRLLKKFEYPQYEEKMVTAHTDEELEYLYAHADAELRFLLLFEDINGSPRYLAGDDDSGDERNAAINYKLFAGRNYVARLRLNHPGPSGKVSLMYY